MKVWQPILSAWSPANLVKVASLSKYTTTNLPAPRNHLKKRSLLTTTVTSRFPSITTMISRHPPRSYHIPRKSKGQMRPTAQASRRKEMSMAQKTPMLLARETTCRSRTVHRNKNRKHLPGFSPSSFILLAAPRMLTCACWQTLPCPMPRQLEDNSP